ncbi:MAG: Asp-tRNA(Asn)/Glu-tRNA(Gln) amidotransferase subunit GatB [Candidatus Helarchaeota archaeon]
MGTEVINSKKYSDKDEVIIGLEVHVQLTKLKTKLFCGCSTDYRGKDPNIYVCPICLGLPGTLPVVNARAVEFAIMVALALECKIPEMTFFYRKNYYYPDMPKNFQITQYNKAGGVPIGLGGQVSFEMNGNPKTVTLTRIQLEEDPGRLSYLGSIISSDYTLVDYNRAGITLLEIVTEPDLRSPKEARLFLQKLRSIIEHLGVADCGLEGAMRCDANISLRGGNRVEIKNISSFKAVQQALEREIIRQRRLKLDGIKVKLETRHWDDNTGRTVSLRVKEEEHDYRYFPEPDLVPIEIDDERIERIRAELPELPDARKERFVHEYHIPDYDAGVLTSSKSLADFFEDCIKIYSTPKTISNWIMSELLRHLNELNLEINESHITPQNFVSMLQHIDEGTISHRSAKKVLWDIVREGKPLDKLLKEHQRISDEKIILKHIEDVFNDKPQAVQDAINDTKTIGYLVGEVMKRTKQNADPKITYQLIKMKINNLKE